MTGTQVNKSAGRAALVRSFLSFGGLSGLGWLLDMSLLLILVAVLRVPEFAANLVSSLVAAGTVFLVSRRFVFASAAGKLPLRTATYLLYTVIVVLIASAALHWISGFISRVARQHIVELDPTTVTAAAKILITPPQLLLNFFMSRFLNERPMEG